MKYLLPAVLYLLAIYTSLHNGGAPRASCPNFNPSTSLVKLKTLPKSSQTTQDEAADPPGTHSTSTTSASPGSSSKLSSAGKSDSSPQTGSKPPSSSQRTSQSAAGPGPTQVRVPSRSTIHKITGTTGSGSRLPSARGQLVLPGSTTAHSKTTSSKASSGQPEATGSTIQRSLSTRTGTFGSSSRVASTLSRPGTRPGTTPRTMSPAAPSRPGAPSLASSSSTLSPSKKPPLALPKPGVSFTASSAPSGPLRHSTTPSRPGAPSGTSRMPGVTPKQLSKVNVGSLGARAPTAPTRPSSSVVSSGPARPVQKPSAAALSATKAKTRPHPRSRSRSKSRERSTGLQYPTKSPASAHGSVVSESGGDKGKEASSGSGGGDRGAGGSGGGEKGASGGAAGGEGAGSSSSGNGDDDDGKHPRRRHLFDINTTDSDSSDTDSDEEIAAAIREASLPSVSKICNEIIYHLKSVDLERFEQSRHNSVEYISEFLKNWETILGMINAKLVAAREKFATKCEGIVTKNDPKLESLCNYLEYRIKDLSVASQKTNKKVKKLQKCLSKISGIYSKSYSDSKSRQGSGSRPSSYVDSSDGRKEHPADSEDSDQERRDAQKLGTKQKRSKRGKRVSTGAVSTDEELVGAVGGMSTTRRPSRSISGSSSSLDSTTSSSDGSAGAESTDCPGGYNGKKVTPQLILEEETATGRFCKDILAVLSITHPSHGALLISEAERFRSSLSSLKGLLESLDRKLEKESARLESLPSPDNCSEMERRLSSSYEQHIKEIGLRKMVYEAKIKVLEECLDKILGVVIKRDLLFLLRPLGISTSQPHATRSSGKKSREDADDEGKESEEESGEEEEESDGTEDGEDLEFDLPQDDTESGSAEAQRLGHDEGSKSDKEK